VKTLFLASCGILLLGRTPAHAAEGNDGITAVAAKASKDYVRVKLPNGSFQIEYYAFGDGGNWGGEIKDLTIDKLKFLDVAHIIAEPLAGQKYFPATDPNRTGLLIMVYWGTTAVPEGADHSIAYSNYNNSEAQLKINMNPHVPEPIAAQNAAISQWSASMTIVNIENQQRTQTDWRNAAMLGYDYDGLVGTDYGKYVEHTAIGRTQKDEVAEIEENRYFVVLMAYDFQLLWKEKKHKLLWETRFSIREANHQFDRDLPSMAQYASQYFGQNTKGLVRTQVPLGRVDIGEVRSLGEVPEGSGTNSGQSPAKP
jgi:hypothetical protein